MPNASRDKGFGQKTPRRRGRKSEFLTPETFPPGTAAAWVARSSMGTGPWAYLTELNRALGVVVKKTYLTIA